MNIFKSWKIPVTVLSVGLLLWAGTGVLNVTSPKKVEKTIVLEKHKALEEKMTRKSMPRFYEIPELETPPSPPSPPASVPPPKISVYGEIKFWAEWVGKVMAGVGSLGVVYRGILVFRKPRIRDEK